MINDNAGWCWFQDERALVDPESQTLVAGSVAAPEGPGGGSRSGNVELAVVDLRTGVSEVVVLHDNLQADDHNAPALCRRSDGRWLAMYTRHKSDDLSRWRISEPGDPSVWGGEQTFDWSELTEGRGVTYSNLRQLDGRLYCFARAVNDDPCALVSDDEGDTWRYAGKLFTRPKVGYVNGYTRYVAGPDRIDLITTDHHPLDYDNSIYHGYLQAGRLLRSDGTVINPAALDPIASAPSQVELTTVVEGGTTIDGVPMTHCWTTDIRRGADGTLAAVISARGAHHPRSRRDGLDALHPVTDHRFLYARLEPGGTWQVHHLAKAGAALLPHEQDYTGLVAIDPYDLDSLYVSTPIDPRDATPLAHYELFHGRTADDGTTWEWSAITEDSPVDNIRPVLAPGDPERIPLLWLRGTMTASQHYNCEAVLLDEARVSPSAPA